MRFEFQPADNDAFEIHSDGGVRSMLIKDLDVLAGEELPAKYPEIVALGRRVYEFLNGPEQWLEGVASNDTLEFDCTRMPKASGVAWELLYDGTAFLVQRGVLPVRVVKGPKVAAWLEPANRPLRLLFMACSPTNVRPVLNFEIEERIILDATAKQPIYFVPEETGFVEELSNTVSSFDPGDIDVFHLTGHGDLFSGKLEGYKEEWQTLQEGEPVFLTENDRGRCRLATAGDFEMVFGTKMPKLVFLSGCRTSEDPGSSEASSFAEALLARGFPAALGWAKPVYDSSATIAAGHLYASLATGLTIEEALRETFRAVTRPEKDQPFQIPDWHLLRLFVPARGQRGMVTSFNHEERETVRPVPRVDEFLDPATKQIKVAGPERFVGRRRSLQRCLAAFDVSGEYTGVVIWGLGGLGKSSLAERLCDRLARKRRFGRTVVMGTLNADRLVAALAAKVQKNADALAALRNSQLSLQGRLESFFEATKKTPLVVVLDDFEQNATLDSSAAAGFKLTRESYEAVEALGKAIRETGSASRLIVTSRYFHVETFPEIGFLTEQLPQMEVAELRKKSRVDESGADEATIEAAFGNPRLFENLSKSDASKDVTQQAFRESLELRKEFDTLSRVEQMDVARLAVYQFPVDPPLVAVVAPDANFKRSIGLGLVEQSETDYVDVSSLRVTDLTRPLVATLLGVDESKRVHGAAARTAYKTWCEGQEEASIGRVLDVVRLACAGGEREIACDLAPRVLGAWNSSSRYREALRWGRSFLETFEDASVLARVAEAERFLGETEAASGHLTRSLELGPVADSAELAHALHEQGRLARRRGDVAEALRLWDESLSIDVRRGDEQGQASTLSAIADVRVQQGDREGALEWYRKSLDLSERGGFARDQATTLQSIANVLLHQRNLEGALAGYLKSLETFERIGDISGQASTLHGIGSVRAKQGDAAEALDRFRRSLDLSEQVGNAEGRAATSNAVASVLEQRGDLIGALEWYQKSLEIYDRIGEVKGQATVLANIAGLAFQSGDKVVAAGQAKRAIRLLDQAQVYSDLEAALWNLAIIAEGEREPLLKQTVWLAAALGLPNLSSVATRLFDVVAPTDPLEVALAELVLLSMAGSLDDTRCLEEARRVTSVAAKSRGMSQEGYYQWIGNTLAGSDDAKRRALAALENSVPADAWLFDRQKVKQTAGRGTMKAEAP